MRLEIPISEVQEYLRNQYQIKIELKNVEVNKIEATYIDSVVLAIVEVKENLLSLHYEVDGLATIVTKVAHFFLEKKLDNTAIEWDSKKRELKINLNKITELKTFLEYVSISKIYFMKDAIVLEMFVRGNI